VRLPFRHFGTNNVMLAKLIYSSSYLTRYLNQMEI